ncbi:YdeI/OmpD-associated family protein [Angustibacter luteus]|uniref:YdeI/OmpD-associated family protein n=1 Tax=Angustibacter luteus TaxID=658456 RepID=A0ABW1JBY4_9ACTN
MTPSTSNARTARRASISFTAKLTAIDGTALVQLPAEASERLPSRGQVAVHASIGGHDVETVIEPDGRRGHWIRVGDSLQRALRITPGDTTEITIDVASDWPEPDLPDDFARALAEAPAKIRGVWEDITPMARWEWVRWVQATRNPETRQRRVDVSLSKLNDGKRRPCCFNLASCTDPDVAKGGKLPEVT